MAKASTIDTKSLVNYTKEAFALPVNLTFLATAAVGFLSLVVAKLGFGIDTSWLAATVLFGSAGLEMLYLGVMPQNRRFVRAVNARRQPDTQRLQAQVKSLNYLTQLGKAPLEKYTELYKKKHQIAQNLEKNRSTSEYFVDSYTAKVETLEAFYVELLFEIERYREFLTRESSSTLPGERAKLLQELQAADNPKVKALYQKRLALMEKRVEKNKAVRENLQMAEIQVATLEDTVNYLVEQSLTLNNPDELSRVIDSVLAETEENHQSILDIQGITEVTDYLTPEVEDADSDTLPPSANQNQLRS